MHVVIGGCGRLGSELTVTLARQGHTIAIVDKAPEVFERLPPGFEGQTLVGMVFDQETLEAAGIHQAGAYLAVTNGDNSNVVSARIAREHYGVERVVARINDPRRAQIYQRLGIRTVATTTWAASEIFDQLFAGDARAEHALGNGDLVLLRLEIGAHLAGTKITALNEEGTSTVAAIDRLGTTTIPAPNATFQAGDVAHVLVARDAIDVLRARLDGAH